MPIDLATKKDIATHGVSVYTESIDWAVNSDLDDKVKLEHVSNQVKLIREALETLKKKQ
jgi:hypothetical protein|tara:strand:- start:151 stop:327 length:177 start_codon:yes stop_codon:yes gene_type:complete